MPANDRSQAGIELEPGLSDWVQDTLGGAITRCARNSSGGSRRSYFIDVERPDRSVISAVLRLEDGSSFTGTEIDLAKEAAVYRALGPTSVPVAAVLGVAPGGSALLLEMISGSSKLEADGAQLDGTLTSFMRVIGDLHSLPVDGLDLPGFARPGTAAEHATLDLAVWEGLAKTIPDLDPLIRYAGAYLLAHPPSHVSRTVLVQGDTGPGNFLAEDSRITGLCDMEFAHLGDPMDDIAWATMRMERLVGDVTPYLDEYTARSGIAVHRESVDYYAIAVRYRCAVTTSLAVARRGGARGWPPYLLATQRYLAELADLLSVRVGLEDVALPLPEVDATTRTSWYDSVLEGIRAGVKGIGDQDLREATRNLQILVHYLRAYDRLGADLESLESEDLGASLHLNADDTDTLHKVAEEAGSRGDRDVLSYLLRRNRRRAALWLTLLDRPRY